MGMGKGLQQTPPVVAGLDEINVTTAETNVPPNYFAGARSLNVSWIMSPIVTQIIPASNNQKKG